LQTIQDALWNHHQRINSAPPATKAQGPPVAGTLAQRLAAPQASQFEKSAPRPI